MNTLTRVLAATFVAFAAGWLAPTGAAAQVDVQAMARGAQTYGQQCARCHVSRSASERSDRDWLTILKHMRARANLTRTQARDVATFLQATNGQEGASGESAIAAEGGREPQGGVPSEVAVREETRLRLVAYLRLLHEVRQWTALPHEAGGDAG